MGLTSSLQIGRSGLLTHQAGIEVTGHNLANVATPGFKRERLEVGAAGQRPIGRGQFVGQGVELTSVTRQVSEAVETRLRGAVSDRNGAAVLQQRLERLEALQNELSGAGLSDGLDRYFNTWSQLSVNPQDPASRGLVVSEGVALAAQLQDLRSGYVDLAGESSALLAEGVADANRILDEIDAVNVAIRQQEGGSGGEAGALRDRRDGLLSQLAEHVDITVNELNDGEIDVFVGSIPVVLDGRSRGLRTETREIGGVDTTVLVTGAEGEATALTPGSGGLAAQLAFANEGVASATEALDEVAAQLIFQVNRAHSQGRGLTPADRHVASYAVADADAALSDREATGLAFAANHGTLSVSVSNGPGGADRTTTIDVNLDGASGTPTTLNTLAAALDAVDGVSASVDATGRLTVAGDTPGTSVAFADDTAGVLATLGVNGFFAGSDASDIAVAAEVSGDPRRLAAGRGPNPGDNRGALAAAGVRDAAVPELGGRSVTQRWADRVAADASELARVRQSAAAAVTVAEGLSAQQAAVSGVNADEETINLLQHQRAYQASARYLSVVDEMLETVLRLV